MIPRLLVLLAALALAVVSASAAEKTPPPPAADDYPLKTCVVSGEPLPPGEFVTYTHEAPGKPLVTIRLCCESCIEEFRGDPEKFLKKLEAARAAAKAKPSAPPKKS